MAWVSEIGFVADAVPHRAAERRCCADLRGLAELPGDGGMAHIAAHCADEEYLARLRRDGARRRAGAGYRLRVVEERSLHR
ncbi:hypothetical protein ACVOMT_04480 [Sphingomonas panni]|jgi:hypothetical protein